MAFGLAAIAFTLGAASGSTAHARSGLEFGAEDSASRDHDPGRAEVSEPAAAGLEARAVDLAAGRAIGWLARDVETSWPADTAALVLYLDRAFDAPGLDALARAAQAGFDAEAAESQGLPATFHRLFGVDARPTTDALSRLPGLTAAVTAQALHCDRVPLGSGYWVSFDRMAAHGGYGLTHALLALQWIEENGCDVVATEMAGRRREASHRLAATLDDVRAPTDLKAEAMAMLVYAGQGGHVQRRHLRWLLQVQRADGGWPLAEDRADSHPHTTVLALWALLASRAGASSAVPMIPVPRVR